MSIGLDIDDREFQAAIADLRKASVYTDRELIDSNGRTYLRAIAYNTPKRTGNGRASWWAAWTALGMDGSPANTRVSPGPWTHKSGRVYVAEGSFDRDTTPGQQSVTFRNRAHVLEGRTRARSGRRENLYYLYAHNRMRGWLEAATREATFKFREQYDRLLKRAS